MSRAVSRRPDRDNRSSYDDRYDYDDRYTERYDDRYDEPPRDRRRDDRYDDGYTERYDDRYDDGYSEPAGRKRRNRNYSPSAFSEESHYTRRRSYPPSSHGTRTRKPASREDKGKDSKLDNLGKASFLVGMITVVAGAFQLWTTKKAVDKEKEMRAQRAREFERRKRERRREEQKELERRERQREWDDQLDAETVSDMRTLTYLPDRQREPSEAPSRAPRLEAAPPEEEDDTASKARSRVSKGRAPSRAPSKAPSRAPSRAPSKAPSRAHSRAPSDLTRQRSDDSFEPPRSEYRRS
ncbi:hypothetical protein Q7P35_005107 [Cladosporium inversicolor]